MNNENQGLMQLEAILHCIDMLAISTLEKDGEQDAGRISPLIEVSKDIIQKLNAKNC